MKKINGVILFLLYSLLSGCSRGPVHVIDFYDIFLSKLAMGENQREVWSPVIGGVVSLLIIAIIGFSYKRRVGRAEGDFGPDGKLSIWTIVNAIMDFVYNLTSSIIGESHVRPFLPLLSGVFIFILVSNLIGLVPGFVPPTDSISTNLAIALIVFITYNFAGIKEHGFHYIKQFLGPVVFLMPLMFIIETVAHLARPVSLSLRLYGNIFGDHLVLSVFTGLTYFILPSFLLFFGLLVACIQSFVFTLLSSIYIALAISDEH